MKDNILLKDEDFLSSLQTNAIKAHNWHCLHDLLHYKLIEPSSIINKDCINQIVNSCKDKKIANLYDWKALWAHLTKDLTSETLPLLLGNPTKPYTSSLFGILWRDNLIETAGALISQATSLSSPIDDDICKMIPCFLTGPQTARSTPPHKARHRTSKKTKQPVHTLTEQEQTQRLNKLLPYLNPITIITLLDTNDQSSLFRHLYDSHKLSTLANTVQIVLTHLKNKNIQLENKVSNMIKHILSNRLNKAQKKRSKKNQSSPNPLVKLFTSLLSSLDATQIIKLLKTPNATQGFLAQALKALKDKKNHTLKQDVKVFIGILKTCFNNDPTLITAYQELITHHLNGEGRNDFLDQINEIRNTLSKEAKQTFTKHFLSTIDNGKEKANIKNYFNQQDGIREIAKKLSGPSISTQTTNTAPIKPIEDALQAIPQESRLTFLSGIKTYIRDPSLKKQQIVQSLLEELKTESDVKRSLSLIMELAPKANIVLKQLQQSLLEKATSNTHPIIAFLKDAHPVNKDLLRILLKKHLQNIINPKKINRYINIAIAYWTKKGGAIDNKEMVSLLTLIQQVEQISTDDPSPFLSEIELYINKDWSDDRQTLLKRLLQLSLEEDAYKILANLSSNPIPFSPTMLPLLKRVLHRPVINEFILSTLTSPPFQEPIIAIAKIISNLNLITKSDERLNQLFPYIIKTQFKPYVDIAIAYYNTGKSISKPTINNFLSDIETTKQTLAKEFHQIFLTEIAAKIENAPANAADAVSNIPNQIALFLKAKAILDTSARKLGFKINPQQKAGTINISYLLKELDSQIRKNDLPIRLLSKLINKKILSFSDYNDTFSSDLTTITLRDGPANSDDSANSIEITIAENRSGVELSMNITISPENVIINHNGINYPFSYGHSHGKPKTCLKLQEHHADAEPSATTATAAAAKKEERQPPRNLKRREKKPTPPPSPKNTLPNTPKNGKTNRPSQKPRDKEQEKAAPPPKDYTATEREELKVLIVETLNYDIQSDDDSASEEDSGMMSSAKHSNKTSYSMQDIITIIIQINEDHKGTVAILNNLLKLDKTTNIQKHIIKQVLDTIHADEKEQQKQKLAAKYAKGIAQHAANEKKNEAEAAAFAATAAAAQDTKKKVWRDIVSSDTFFVYDEKGNKIFQEHKFDEYFNNNLQHFNMETTEQQNKLNIEIKAILTTPDYRPQEVRLPNATFELDHTTAHATPDGSTKNKITVFYQKDDATVTIYFIAMHNSTKKGCNPTYKILDQNPELGLQNYRNSTITFNNKK